MSLRRRTLILVGVTLLLLLVVFSTAGVQITLTGFRDLEAQNAQTAARRTAALVDEQLAAIGATGRDYAFWNDSYDFLQGDYPEYIADNLNAETLSSLRLNLFVMLFPDGQVATSIAADLASGEERPLPLGLAERLTLGSALLPVPMPAEGLTGIVMLPEAPLLIAVTPVLRGDRSGPPAGTLIIGRLLDATEIARLAEIASLDLRLIASDEPPLERSGPAPLLRETRDFLRTFAFLPDLEGRQPAALELTIARTIYAQGLESVQWLLVALGASGLIFGGMILFFLERLVLRRVTELSRAVIAVAESGDLSRRFPVTDSDELTELAAAGNQMLGALEQSQRELALARDEAEAANRAKSQFLSNMSHELRTPLTAIIGYAELLREEFPTAAQLDHDIDQIVRSGNHLLHLINDLLDLAKVEAGHAQLHPEPVELGSLGDDLYALVLPLAARRANHLLIEHDHAPAVIVLDRMRLRQILLNLLSNAAKFTQDGTITLTISSPNPQTIQFVVRDTGIGMSAEQQQRIFQPFVQATEQIANDYGGTGLGLAITREFCHLMGGSIGVVSQPGRGSTFTVTLPLVLP